MLRILWNVSVAVTAAAAAATNSWNGSGLQNSENFHWKRHKNLMRRATNVRFTRTYIPICVRNVYKIYMILATNTYRQNTKL